MNIYFYLLIFWMKYNGLKYNRYEPYYTNFVATSFPEIINYWLLVEFNLILLFLFATEISYGTYG